MRTHSKAVAAALSLCFPALAQDLLPVNGAITFAEANRRAAMPRWLSLKHGEFDTAGAAPAIPADLRSQPVTGDAYHLV